MTREAAELELHRLSIGLAVDDGGVRRLLERVAERGSDPELLRALLTEAGARVVLEGEAR